MSVVFVFVGVFAAVGVSGRFMGLSGGVGVVAVCPQKLHTVIFLPK